MIYELLKTSGKEPHSHLVYFTPQRVGALGFVSSGTVSGHSHEISLDPQTQSLVVRAASGERGRPHTHELAALLPEDREVPDEDKDEAEEIKELREKFQESCSIEQKSRECAEESEDFYEGKQWDEADIAALDAENRFHITINEISPKIDLLVGYQRQNRTDGRFFPTEDGDQAVAQVLTMLTKQILTANNIELVDSAIFKDALIAGRGQYHLFVDYSRSITGEIVIENIGWRDVYYGPHEKIDGSDLEYLTKSKWFSKEKIKLMYPDKAEEIELMYSSYSDGTSTSKTITVPGKEYTLEGGATKLSQNDIDKKKRSIRLYEQWSKDYDKTYSVAEINDGFNASYDRLNNSERKQLEAQGLIVAAKTKVRMKVVVAAGTVLLDSRYEDQEDFNIIPSYAKKGKEKWYGKVEELKEPQREVNKRHSQSIDVVNKVSGYGWIIDGDTFDGREEAEFRRNSSKGGFIAKVKNKNNMPQKTEGSRMPTELVGMMDIASQKIDKIANISPESMGFNGREISSVSLMETRRNTMMAQEHLFDNLAQAKKRMLRLLVSMIRKTYSVERILRLINNPNPSSDEEMQLNQINAQAAAQLLQTTDLENYDVAVELSPTAPSVRSANFAMTMEMMKMGMQIPPEVLFEASDMANKNKILGMIAQKAAAAAQESQQKTQSEVQKSQIAADGKVKAELIKQQGASPTPGIPQ